MSYVLRVVLPDRPGTLGAVATALGHVDADILAMDIVERSGGNAVDDLVVDIPRTRQPDALITAAESVPGVRVESVRPDPGVADAHREWELVEALAADPAKAVHTLADLLPQVLRVGWASIVEVAANGDRLGAGRPAAALRNWPDVPAGWAPVTRPTALDPEACLGPGVMADGRHLSGCRAAGCGTDDRAGGATRRTGAAGVRGRPARPPRRSGRRDRRPGPRTCRIRAAPPGRPAGGRSGVDGHPAGTPGAACARPPTRPDRVAARSRRAGRSTARSPSRPGCAG